MIAAVARAMAPASPTGGIGPRNQAQRAMTEPLRRQRRRSAEDDAGQRFAHAEGSSMMLTWAATIRQPMGKRTHVCICRPILLDAPSRRNSVAAIAQSRP